MRRCAAVFVSIAVLAALLAGLSIALFDKGYPFGSLGLGRLEAMAGPASFLPLAALYAACAALIMIVPVRAAGFVHTNVAEPLVSATLALLAAIVGVQAARFAFGSDGALRKLADWHLLPALAIVGVHLVLNPLRRNLLLRTLTFIVALAAMLACLYWKFRF